MAKRATDEEILKRLKERAPEVLSVRVDFDAVVRKILAAGSVETARAPKRAKSKRKKRVVRHASE